MDFCEQAASTQTGMCTDVVCFSLSPPPQRHCKSDENGTSGRTGSCSKSTGSNNKSNNNRSHVDDEHRGARCRGGSDRVVGAAADVGGSNAVTSNTDNHSNCGSNNSSSDNSVDNNCSDGDHNREGGGESEGVEWQEIVVPHDNSLRGREWRVLVKSCHVVDMEGEREESASRVVGAQDGTVMSLELELKEVRDDSTCFSSSLTFPTSSHVMPCSFAVPP